ncbi:MAG: hypothetical protein LC667_07630 [Thioalkalivibrio sp.]|nr:hypothetical protein [Thioalkalivibrio sp.]
MSENRLTQLVARYHFRFRDGDLAASSVTRDEQAASSLELADAVEELGLLSITLELAIRLGDKALEEETEERLEAARVRAGDAFIRRSAAFDF